MLISVGCLIISFSVTALAFGCGTSTPGAENVKAQTDQRTSSPGEKGVLTTTAASSPALATASPSPSASPTKAQPGPTVTARSAVGGLIGTESHLCIETVGGGTGNGTRLELMACNGSAGQFWQPHNGGIRNIRSGRCLDLANGGTNNETAVQLWDCNGSPGQVWRPNYNEGLRNPGSGRCLDAKHYYSSGPKPLILWDCTGDRNQRWHLPIGNRLWSPIIDVDYSEAPDLADWAKQAAAMLRTWYPTIVATLATPEYAPPSVVRVRVDPAYIGAAVTRGELISANPDFIRKYPTDVGWLAHEAVHVAQRYVDCPGWITEGIADWFRQYRYEPNKTYNKPSGSYLSGYRNAAVLLDYAARSYDPKLVHLVNVACVQGTYASDIWVRLTGKTTDQLWAEIPK